MADKGGHTIYVVTLIVMFTGVFSNLVGASRMCGMITREIHRDDILFFQLFYQQVSDFLSPSR